MEIKKNFSLKNYNTFGIEIYADFFVSVSSVNEIKEALIFQKNNNLPLLILGGGSNILFTQPFKGLVLHINLLGKEILKENTIENTLLIKVSSGENWHSFVQWCVEKDYGGLENLSLIPGKVGACPIQNIGAYGVEVKGAIHSVEAIDIETATQISYLNKTCDFGYRNSVFKTQLKDKVIITAVNFNLSSKNHLLKISYGDITNQLQNKKKPTIQEISNAVIAIRKSKLPDYTILGNAGSFFKNPIISIEEFELLKLIFPAIVNYPTKVGIKLAAGWLIENSGWKGKSIGKVAVHNQQSLVLVNLGNAQGIDVLNLSKAIQKDVYTKFKLVLETEVNIL